jgi:hypothetical protein
MKILPRVVMGLLVLVTGKAAVTKTAGSDEAKVVRERLLGVVGGRHAR